jgi:hypothetical protein
MSTQHTHRLVYLARHMFIDLPEGRFLVDTGCPVSFGGTGSYGSTGTASYGGTTRQLPRSYGSLTIESLAGLDLDARIGQRCAGLIGMDILGRDPVLWDGPRGRAVVRPAPAPSGAVRIPVQEVQTIPVIEVTVAGRAARCIFDSGAQYGFMTEPPMTEPFMVEPAMEDGEFDDFHPALLGFRSKAWKMPVDAQGVRFRERFGFHEPLSSSMLRPFGVDGLIGCSWLPTRRVWFVPSAPSIESCLFVAAG